MEDMAEAKVQEETISVGENVARSSSTLYHTISSSLLDPSPPIIGILSLHFPSLPFPTLPSLQSFLSSSPSLSFSTGLYNHSSSINHLKFHPTIKLNSKDMLPYSVIVGSSGQPCMTTPNRVKRLTALQENSGYLVHVPVPAR